jgi:Xaa-Pro dipeptidase
VYANMNPGTSWVDCHRFAEREILKALHDANILHNGTIDEYVANDIGAVFFPHGLGHLIGSDTHDAGGYLTGTPLRATKPGVSKLRTARVLEAGMVLTNEPGCYFIDFLLDSALADPNKAKFINTDVLANYRGMGGVRIEDVVLVTEAGAECLSTCPRTVAEIENVIAGGEWPPARDEAPELKRKWTKLAADGSSMELLNL